jgi:hypothetical protein
MPEVRDGLQVMAMLERGELGPALSTEITSILQHLNTVAADRGKAKGKLKITLSFDVEEGAVRIRADLAQTLPKLARPESLFFITEDGGISTQHPQQTSLFDGPRAVETATR